MAKEKASRAKGGLPVLTMDRLREEAKKYPEIDEDAKVKYREFHDKFGYEKLRALSDDEVLNYICFRTGDDSSLCSTLDHGKDYGDFGSVNVQGNVYVYKIFKRGDGKWCASKPLVKTQGELSDQDENGDPLKFAIQLRDILVKGAEFIEGWKRFDSVDDYKDLYRELEKITEGIIKEMWIRKYYYMLYPDRFPQFYRDTFMAEVLTSLGEPATGDIYEQTGRIACYTKKCHISNRMMGHLYYVLVTSAKVLENLEKYPKNRIVFGAPGTGKSFLLNEQRKECFAEGNYERVTFHPDYSYANFVGTYKPVVTPNGKEFEKGSMDEWKKIIGILTDEAKTAQEKYDEIKRSNFDIFGRGANSSRLPVVLGLYCDDCPQNFDATSNTYDPMINLGQSAGLREFVKLYSGPDDYLSSGTISYEFVPGPFMRVYVEAKSHPDEPYLLMIEEINRADVAAVFGDVFQLLDRVDDAKDGTVGESRYPVHASNDVKNYLAKELGGNSADYSEIRIPKNMYIWATMNSADQGVFPMDTAFKRRWDFEYIGINDSDDKLKGKRVRLGRDGAQIVEWNALRKAINDRLAYKKINEDKQLGPYFIETKVLDADEENPRSEKFIKVFKDKVLMYLYEDAGRQIRQDLFDNNLRYSEICKKFDEDGVNVFCKEIRDYKGGIIENSQVGQGNGESDEGNN